MYVFPYLIIQKSTITIIKFTQMFIKQFLTSFHTIQNTKINTIKNNLSFSKYTEKA